MSRLLMTVCLSALTLSLSACSKYIVAPGPYGQPTIAQVPAQPEEKSSPKGEPAVAPGEEIKTPTTPTTAATSVVELPDAPRGSITFTVKNSATGATCDVIKNGLPWCNNMATNQWCTDVLTNYRRASRIVTYIASCTTGDGTVSDKTKKVTVPRYSARRSTRSEVLIIRDVR